MEITDISDMKGYELYGLLQTIKKSDKPYDIKRQEVGIIVSEINNRSKKIASKNNKKYHPISVEYVLR